MFGNLLKNDPDSFIELLNSDQIHLDEAIKSYLKNKDFKAKERIFYEIVKKMYLKKVKNISEELLSKFFDGNIELVFDLLKNGYVEAKFPIVKEEYGKIARVMVIKSENSFSNVKLNKLRVIENVVGHRLAVIFDSKFVGNSFMLATALAALTSKIPINLAFSGEIDEEGVIKKNLDGFSIKERVCSENNLKLIGAFDVSNVFELKEFFEEENFHIPVLMFFRKEEEEYINFSYEKLFKSVSKKYPVRFAELFEKVYDVKKFFVTNELSSLEKWKKALKEAKAFLLKIISNGGIPHVAIVGPSAMAMALGIAIGLQNPLVIYHKQDEYYPVIDLTDNLRKIKNIKDSYEYLKYTTFDEGKDCAYVIYLASHNPFSSVIKFLENNSLDSKIILIEPIENKGNLSIDTWGKIVSELMSITQNVLYDNYCENVFFFLSCPVAIALGFGMAFGDFAKGGIFHYNKADDSYIEVFKIERIRGD
ncbi:hypothetical protein SU69_08455 [Thermosipho melanesiensis]|uniref:SMODS-associated and fused to various effectors domain-containing protein n=2 Tax=Thermosipho melanesiensis TaxID=46541 RepID=A6LNL0_THEM4|nr:SAVED domain-containing protein [Thermosipho melanesiensis]ABR31511.1 hypothetical protein Tmel_1668 [Thermosipho melanesiensis BI429]APT74561.1 hypothetical protein BW47_08830 [Thermosipho melanesiensis]OOC35259.1 hypothetical protein SU69_08455 [Thermosipho melanesiensis]OOC35478.1 hypothetical protein SU70_08465 [Thermosipho melanesiensis]OOC36514.1 hypothetical protein SU68_08520 [Thermosipho melanesiensis]